MQTMLLTSSVFYRRSRYSIMLNIFSLWLLTSSFTSTNTNFFVLAAAASSSTESHDNDSDNLNLTQQAVKKLIEYKKFFSMNHLSKTTQSIIKKTISPSVFGDFGNALVNYVDDITGNTNGSGGENNQSSSSYARFLPNAIIHESVFEEDQDLHDLSGEKKEEVLEKLIQKLPLDLLVNTNHVTNNNLNLRTLLQEELQLSIARHNSSSGKEQYHDSLYSYTKDKSSFPSDIKINPLLQDLLSSSVCRNLLVTYCMRKLSGKQFFGNEESMEFPIKGSVVFNPKDDSAARFGKEETYEFKSSSSKSKAASSFNIIKSTKNNSFQH